MEIIDKKQPPYLPTYFTNSSTTNAQAYLNITSKQPISYTTHYKFQLYFL